MLDENIVILQGGDNGLRQLEPKQTASRVNGLCERDEEGKKSVCGSSGSARTAASNQRV